MTSFTRNLERRCVAVTILGTFFFPSTFVVDAKKNATVVTPLVNSTDEGEIADVDSLLADANEVSGVQTMNFEFALGSTTVGPDVDSSTTAEPNVGTTADPEPDIDTTTANPDSGFAHKGSMLSLGTTFESVRASRPGHMFNLEAFNDVCIRAMEVNIASEKEDIPMKLYLRDGSFHGYEEKEEDWEMWDNFTVAGRGKGHRSYIKEGSFRPFTCSKGETCGIYVTTDTKDWTERVMMVTGKIRDTDKYENEDFMIDSGASTKFFKRFKKDKLWNGVLHYVTGSCPEDEEVI